MLSDSIREHRKRNNMSQDELAEKLGVSRQSVSLWENGQTQPTIDNIIALARIFNTTADELLENTDGTGNGIRLPEEEIPPETALPESSGKSARVWVLRIGAVVLSVAIVLLAVFGTRYLRSGDPDSSAVTPSARLAQAPTDDENTPAPTTTAGTKKPETPPKKTNTQPAATATTTSAPAKIDLFAYCKEFAIKTGHVNGDYTIYQQPATRYGGYNNEYFSVSYWGDSNMVEFCLHCPLNETYSVNFYLRMRGGYNGKYEYLSSRYYRDTGESRRSASGYIDPAVFTDTYPLNCDEYTGGADGQNEFMEESRQGICDLIRCLKQFVTVENMDCTFSDFGFEHF